MSDLALVIWGMVIGGAIMDHFWRKIMKARDETVTHRMGVAVIEALAKVQEDQVFAGKGVTIRRGLIITTGGGEYKLSIVAEADGSIDAESLLSD